MTAKEKSAAFADNLGRVITPQTVVELKSVAVLMVEQVEEQG